MALALVARCVVFACACLLLPTCTRAAPVATVKLDKQYVPLKRGDRVVAHKTAYFGSIFVGVPQSQRFTVVFDTGSGHILVPSGACGSPTCLKHRRYNRELSASAVDIDHSGAEVAKNATERDQVSIAFGTGDVLGEFVKEIVCLSEPHGSSPTWEQRKYCIKMRVITASEMTEEPFINFAFDGVVGLGLDALAVDPEFSYFGQMAKAGMLPENRFGFFLSTRDDVPSEIAIGGHDENRVSEDLRWAKVVQPELGHWQLHIRSVKIGGISLPLCDSGKCVGIVDSGTSLLGVPSQGIRDIHWKLARKIAGDPSDLDCRHVGGPDVVFDLGGFEVSLGPEDYSRPTAMRVESNSTGQVQVLCRASLLPVDMGADGGNPLTFILGEPILRKYYTAFDWSKKEIGFALARQSPPGDIAIATRSSIKSQASHTVFGAPSAEPLAPVSVQI